MKLVCPKCMTHLKISADKIPSIGGWARCPKCAERFFVQPPGKGVDLLVEDQKGQAAGRRPTRDLASQRLIDRLRSSRGDSPDTIGYGPLINSEVTIFPEPAGSPALYQGIGIALLAMPLLLLVVAFMIKSEPTSTSENEIEILRTDFNNEKSLQLLQSDLATIKRDMINRAKITKTVTQSGSESRVFKYFSDRMAPGICPSISSIEIVADSPRQGFEATGICSEGTTKRLKIFFKWTDRTAVVSLVGSSSKYEEVVMYPARPMAAK